MMPKDEQKTLLPEYLARIGVEVKKFGNRLKCLCPLHKDRTPSFEAELKGCGWVWHCFPCGLGGDVFTLHAALQGLEAKGDFREVSNGVAAVLGGEVEASSRIARSRVVLPIVEAADERDKSLPAEELTALTTPWREALVNGRCPLGLLLEFREIGAATLKRLALPPLDALGVVPAGHVMQSKSGRKSVLNAPRWAYIGDGGYCVRQPFGRGVEPRFWRVGRLRRPWRSHRLESPDVSVVHLVESESSCMALIAAGYETDTVAVVAAPGAAGFKPEWARWFTGREIHFWPDCDAAGAKFVERAAAALQGQAGRMMVHEIKGAMEGIQ